MSAPASALGIKQASSTLSKSSWVVYGSPLWHRDRVPSSIRSLPPIPTLKGLEENFVNDSVKTTTSSRSGRNPIIPQYDAVGDKYAKHYFMSPNVRAMMERNKAVRSHKESQHSSRSLNKLSFRRKCRLTPNADEMELRELQFVNDGIITERRRTKYKDIIPPYDATEDQHSKGYFKRPDIKRLVTVTCSPRSPRVN
ncbi:uncharacterized protein LOC124116101 isoform X2 [Haliotis rufescens]|uniref:uncharacterized protein LOC124116101 isoform X2 n=1 Tax=Haliotis rufescens TaxID=6454 RepID=UPI001EB0474A|nr:uncharacterized protein LOC124116101 isoform X2 [Haliotis rufescens]